jgi:DNA-binding transcriptional LysR family regulator
MSLLDPRLEAFMAIVDSGTVHGASSALGLTQTGITQRIRSLESKLSTTLFIRSRTGMKLTEEGESLRRYCLGALEIEAQTVPHVGNAATKQTIEVTVAGPTSIMSARILPNCFTLYKKYPNLLLHFRLYEEEDRIELLKKGIVDLAIVSPDEVRLEMDSKIIKPDRYVLVASSKWKGRRLQNIIEEERIINFHEKDETTLRYLKKYDLAKSARKDRIFANTNFAVISMVKEGIGYGTLTEEVASSHLAQGDLVMLNSKQALENPQAIAWYPRKQMPAYFEDLIKSIR